jgi:hypothetical protein
MPRELLRAPRAAPLVKPPIQLTPIAARQNASQAYKNCCRKRLTVREAYVDATTSCKHV